MGKSVRVVIVSFLFSFGLLGCIADATDTKTAEVKDQSFRDQITDLFSSETSLPPPDVQVRPYWDGQDQVFRFKATLEPSPKFYENVLDALDLQIRVGIDGKTPVLWQYDNPITVEAGAKLRIRQSMQGHRDRRDTITVPDGSNLEHFSVTITDTENDLLVSDNQVELYQDTANTTDAAAAFRFELPKLINRETVQNAWLSVELDQPLKAAEFVDIQFLADQVEPLSTVVLESFPYQHTDVVRIESRGSRAESESMPLLIDALMAGAQKVDIGLSGFSSTIRMSDLDVGYSARLHVVMSGVGDSTTITENRIEQVLGIDDNGGTASGELIAESDKGIVLQSDALTNTDRLAKTGTATQSLNATLVSSASVQPHAAPGPVPPNTVVYGEIADDFKVNALGGGNYTIPVPLPQSPGGLTPDLSLAYNSTAGEGLVGVGWSLNGLSTIRRCAKYYAKDNERRRVLHQTDDDYCLDGNRLVLESNHPQPTYRTSNDTFKKIVRVKTGLDDGWTVHTPDGKTYYYGLSIESGQNNENNGRIEGVLASTGNPDTPTHVWALSSASDKNLKNFKVIYFEDDTSTQHFPIEFRYGSQDGMRIRVLFQYYDQHLSWPQHQQITYRHGYKFTQSRRLKSIEVRRGSTTLHNYFFDYEIQPEFSQWKLSKLRYCTPSKCLPAKTFSWQDRNQGPNATSGIWSASGQQYSDHIVSGDFNGDGRTDVITTGYGVCLSMGNNFNCNSQSHDFIDDDNDIPIVGDYNGDGLDDYIIKSNSGAWRYCEAQLSNGAVWFNCKTTNNFSTNAGDLKSGDFDGDGRQDLFNVNTRRIFFGNGSAPTGFYLVSSTEFKVGAVSVGATVGMYTQALDINGDGATDLLMYRGTDKQWFSCVALNTILENAVSNFSCTSEAGSYLPVQVTGNQSMDLRPADFNADGLSDLLLYMENTDNWRVYYSNGSESGRRYTTFRNLTEITGEYEHSVVGDLNGDGSADIAIWQQAADWKVAYGAAGTFRIVNNVHYPNPGAFGGGKISEVVSLGDFDGDGRQDLVKPSPNQVVVRLSEAFSAPLLNQVISKRPAAAGGDKVTLDLDYGYLTKEPSSGGSYPNRTIYHTHVVTSAKVPGNRTGEFDTTQFDYDQLHVNKRGLGVLGFNERAETDVRRQLKTTYFYHDQFPFVGRINKVVTASLHSGSPKNQKVKFYKHTVRGDNNYTFTTNPHSANVAPPNPVPSRYWVYTKEEMIDGYDYHTNTHVSRTINDYSYNFDGNGRSSDYGKVHIHKRTASDLVNNRQWVDTTSHLYHNKPTDYLMGLRVETKLKTDTNAIGSGPAVTKTRVYSYDNKGQLETVVIEPDKGPSKGHEYLWTKYLYDSDGNIKEEVTAGNTFGHQSLPIRVTKTTTSYHTAGQSSISGSVLNQAIKREVITNALNQVMTVESDLTHNQPLLIKDVNGLITRYSYDDFGRKPKITASDSTSTHVVQHDWVTAAGGTIQSDAPAHAEFFIRTEFKNTSTGGVQQAPLTEYYDAHANLLRTVQERWHAGNPVQVTYTYDVLDRLTKETAPHYRSQGYRTTHRAYYGHTNQLRYLIDHRGPRQDYTYHKYTTTRVDSDGHMHRETRNVKDQVILVEEGDSTNLSTMTYRYDDVGRLRQAIDTDGNTTIQYYDLRDNRLVLIDPDLGRIDYRHDSYQDLVWQRNARHQVTRSYYDKLGRLTRQFDPSSDQRNYYDTRPNGIGKLALTTYRDAAQSVAHYRQTPSYDNLGRLSSSVECIDAVGGSGCSNHTTSYQYDAFSRLALTTLPGGKKVAREYKNGILQRLRRGVNGSLIWQVNNMDARGRPFIEVSGNNVVTRRTYTYANQQGGMMTKLRVHKGTTDLMVRNYTYHPSNAQLASRHDEQFNHTENFTYDKHRRVKTHEIVASGTTSNYTYQYDKLGNITSKPDQPETVNQIYTYGDGITVNGAGPHAIKSLGNRQFIYDASGNLLDDGTRTARWKAFDKPEMLRKGSATIWFEYGAGHQRLRRRQGNFNTWYLDGGPDVRIERLTHSSNSDVTTRYHYEVDGDVVAIDEETASGTTSRYLHSDRLGSASVLANATGGVLERQSHGLWGRVRTLTSGAISTIAKSQYHTKSYTGHESLHDVELVHMNGRVYDPVLGRFMSADPFVQYPNNTQSFNRYSYVLNNPMGATDPSGYMSDSVDGSNTDSFEGEEVTWTEVKTYVGGGGSGGTPDNSIGNGNHNETGASTSTQIGNEPQKGAAIPGDDDDNDPFGDANGLSRGQQQGAAAINDVLSGGADVADGYMAGGGWFGLGGLFGALVAKVGLKFLGKRPTNSAVQLSGKNSKKLGQQIGRWKREMGGQGGAKEFLEHASNLATEARKAGTFVTGEIGQGAGALGKATIYRRGNEYLVEQGGQIMSYVANPGKGGIVDEFVRLGGKL